jgi:hypothetical protein
MLKEDIENAAKVRFSEYWSSKENNIFANGFYLGAMYVSEHGYKASKNKSIIYDIPSDTEDNNYLRRNGFEVGALWMADRVKKGDKLLD